MQHETIIDSSAPAPSAIIFSSEVSNPTVDDKPDLIRGIYVNVRKLANEEYASEIDELLASTALNAMVIDVKGDGGTVYFNSSVKLAHELNAVNVKLTSEQLQTYKENDIYLIARVVAYKDSFLPKVVPDDVFEYIDSGETYKLAGTPMLDPSSEKVQEYVTDIAVDACKLGFDEIQFDYIRYPASKPSNLNHAAGLTEAVRVENITSMLSNSRELINREGCVVSADIFAWAMIESTDLGIGHHVRSIAENVDIVSPMIYPSLYHDGALGYDDPYNYPYEVVSETLENGLRQGIENQNITAWLQSFSYSKEGIQSQITAAEDHNVSWLLWGSNFDSSYFDIFI